MKQRTEDLLESILMAAEQGATTLEEIRGTNLEDSCVDLMDEDVSQLVEKGLIEVEDGRLRLTERGMTIAERIVRRHRLAEVLLFTLLGVDRELASEIGCRVEHGIRDEMLDGVCTLLGHPSTCPHGRPIPPGECCRARKTTVQRQVVPLTELRPGERARVVYIMPRNHHRLHRLASFGLHPGVEIEVHQRRPAYCLRFEESEVALDRDVAEDIQVARLNGGDQHG